MSHAARVFGLAHSGTVEEARPQRRLLTIILTSGDEDGGRRATLAFSAACSARAMGVETLVYLVGDGVCWGGAQHADYFHAAGFPPLNQLIDNFVQAGGQLYQCATNTNAGNQSQPDEGRYKRRQGVQIMGFASLIDQLSSSSAITF
jgi:predicted peroxiredoxin